MKSDTRLARAALAELLSDEDFSIWAQNVSEKVLMEYTPIHQLAMGAIMVSTARVVIEDNPEALALIAEDNSSVVGIINGMLDVSYERGKKTFEWIDSLPKEAVEAMAEAMEKGKLRH